MSRLFSAVLLAGTAASLLASSSTARVTGAQVTFDNRFGVRADLDVNGGYGCTALDGLTCTTQVPAGDITLSARVTGGTEILFTESGWIDEGWSVTWPAWITE